jgi:hypothetical protein
MFRSIRRKVCAASACAGAALIVMCLSTTSSATLSDRASFRDGRAQDYMLIDAGRLASLPMSGAAWQRLTQTADRAIAGMSLNVSSPSSSSPWLSNYFPRKNSR